MSESLSGHIRKGAEGASLRSQQTDRLGSENRDLVLLGASIKHQE